MPEEDYRRGETVQKLKNIEENISDIKLEMRDHNASDKIEFGKLNDKVDTVHESAQSAANTASRAAEALKEQELVNTTRHEEIVKAIEKLTKDQSDIKLRMYLLAAFIGGGSGSLIQIIKNWPWPL